MCVCVACYNKQAVSDKQIGGHLQFMAFRHGMRLIQEPPSRCCDLDSSIDIGAVPSFHSTAGFGFLSRIRSFKHSTCWITNCLTIEDVATHFFRIWWNNHWMPLENIINDKWWLVENSSGIPYNNQPSGDQNPLGDCLSTSQYKGRLDFEHCSLNIHPN